MAEQEPTLLDFGLEFFPVVALADVGIAESEGLVVDVLLDLSKQILDVGIHPIEADGGLLESVAAGDFHRACGEIAGAEGDAYRNALDFPLCELESRAESVAVVNLHTHALGCEGGLDCLELAEYGGALLVGLVDGDHHDLDGGEQGRQHEPVVVAVRHDESSHQTGADAP